MINLPDRWTGRPTRVGTFVTMLLSGAFAGFALSPFAPDLWHDTPSLIWLNSLLPYWVMAVAFLAYLILLLIPHWLLRTLAYGLGLAAYGVGLVALAVTTRTDRPTNPLLIAAVLLAIDLHLTQLLFAIRRRALAESEAT